MLEHLSFTDLLALHTFIKKNQKWPYPSKKEAQLLDAITSEAKKRQMELQNELDKKLNPPQPSFQRTKKTENHSQFKRTK